MSGGDAVPLEQRLLIISAPGFEDVLPPFLAQRAAAGWSIRSVVIGQQRVLAESESLASEPGARRTRISSVLPAEALRKMIRRQYESDATWPSHLLLVGDTDTIPAWPGHGAYRPDTDLYYACMDGEDDWVPDMAYGRLPARTPEQLQIMLDRILAYEPGAGIGLEAASRAIFIASEENYRLTEGTHETVIARHLAPRQCTPARLYRHTYGATTPQVLDAINAGCGLVTFSGHGGGELWLDPRFEIADVLRLTSTTTWPLVLSFACDTGAFADFDECFAEAWLRQDAGGGAIAVLAASEDSYWEEDDVFEQCVFDALFAVEEVTLGEAVLMAKQRYLAYYGTSPETLQYFEQYNLLGDPTMQLHRLPGVSKGATLAAQRRLLQPCFEPGGTLRVEIAVEGLGEVDTPVALEERLPVGWVIVNSTWNGAELAPVFWNDVWSWDLDRPGEGEAGRLEYQARVAGSSEAWTAIAGLLVRGESVTPVDGDCEIRACGVPGLGISLAGAGFLTLRWADPEETYEVERSPSIDPGLWVTVDSQASRTEGVRQLNVPAGENAGFYRLRRREMPEGAR